MRLVEAEILKLLPTFMQKDYFVRMLSAVTSEATSELAYDVTFVTKWDKIDEMEEDFLDALAKELDIDWYLYDADVDRKRAIIKDSYRLHTVFGTRNAVRSVLDMYFGTYDENTGKWVSDADVVEWWEPGYPFNKQFYFSALDPGGNKKPNGNCYGFAVISPDVNLTPKQIGDMKFVVNKVKSERSLLSIFIILAIKGPGVSVDSRIDWDRAVKIYPPFTPGFYPDGQYSGIWRDADIPRYISRVYGNSYPGGVNLTFTGDRTKSVVTGDTYSLLLPEDTYTVTGTKAGYKTFSGEVVVKGDTEYNILLEGYNTVSGTVTDTDDNALAGVQVSVNGVYKTTTDANGEYSFDLNNGTYTLTFEKNHYETATEYITVADADVTCDVSLVFLEHEVTIKTTVDGFPTAGVVISVDGTEIATTDSTGEYVTTVLEGYHTFSAYYAPYVCGASDTVYIAADSEVTLAMVDERTWAVMCVVTIPSGERPVAYATVTADTGETAECDDQGNGTLYLKKGTHTLTAEKYGYREGTTSVTVDPSNPPTSYTYIALNTASRVTASVYDRQTRQLLTGVSITLYSSTYTDTQTVQNSGMWDGMAVFYNMPFGSYRLKYGGQYSDPFTVDGYGAVYNWQFEIN